MFVILYQQNVFLAIDFMINRTFADFRWAMNGLHNSLVPSNANKAYVKMFLSSDQQFWLNVSNSTYNLMANYLLNDFTEFVH